MATVTDTVEVVAGPSPDAAALDARVEELRRRFPRAIVDRYLALAARGRRARALAPGAAVAGDVRLADDVSVWYGCVLRGDLAPDHRRRAHQRPGRQRAARRRRRPCIVGADVIVGHRAMLHACRVEDACLIGMQATVLDDAVIGAGSVVGAGAVVTQRTMIPPRSLVLGVPAKVVKTLTDAEEKFHRAHAAKYVRLKENYLRDALRVAPR